MNNHELNFYNLTMNCQFRYSEFCVMSLTLQHLRLIYIYHGNLSHYVERVAPAACQVEVDQGKGYTTSNFTPQGCAEGDS